MYFIGIDIGTTATKAALFTDNGETLFKESVEYTIFSKNGSMFEQNPETWYNSVLILLKELFSKTKIKPSEIGGIGITGQSPSLVILDANDKPLTNSIIWMDGRAVKEAKVIREKYNFPTTPSSYSSKLLWLIKNETEKMKRAKKIFEKASDFITYKLTGKYVRGRIFKYDEFELSKSLLEEYALDSIELPEEQLPTTFIGPLKPDIAKFLEISNEVSITAGGVDGISSLFGTNTVTEKKASVCLGTSLTIDVCTHKPVIDDRFLCNYNLIVKKWYVAAISNSGGVNYDWFRKAFAKLEETTGELTGIDVYHLLDLEAEKSPPGSRHLIFLPYIAGERFPYNDPFAKGVFFGITPQHVRSDFIRSILEGVAFSLYQIIFILKEKEIPINEIILSGDSAKNNIWPRIIADVIGMDLLIPRTLDTTVLGAAIQSAVASHAFKSISQVSRRMVKIERKIKYNREAHRDYHSLFEVYRELYPRLKTLFVKLHNIRTSKEKVGGIIG